jgi:isopenicillin-N epimerase
MVSMPIPPCDVAAVKAALLDRYRIEIPVLEWGGRALVRLSCQGYNTRAQMDSLLAALSELLALGEVKRRAGAPAS